VKQKGGFLPGFGVAKGLTSLSGRFVKNKGAKKALTESLRTKLKNAWLGMTGQMGKKIHQDIRKQGYTRISRKR